MRDVKEFQQRFNRYKNGESVSDIYSLPKYAPGKNPWDDSVDFITRYEGWSDTAYLKKGDVPTIGYGTTNPKWVSKGRITKNQGRTAMAEDLALGEPLLRKNIKDYDKLPDTAKTVLRDILYNVGQGNLFNKSPKFMKALNSGNWQEAANQMDWDNNKPGMGGAKIRNAARLKLFLLDLQNHPVVLESLFVLDLRDSEWKPKNILQMPKPISLDYDLNVQAPQSLNIYNNADSPAYKYRIPDLYLFLLQQDLMLFKDGKSPIHIKHPGRLTALKKRTGKSEAELYNDGNPAHKKMVVFARNARKWKH